MEKPKRCFCKIPPHDLVKWAHEKYINGYSTLDLMKKAETPTDKEMITIIAMLDVEKSELDTMLGHQTKPGCNLDHCRNAVKELIMTILNDKSAS